MGTWAFASLTVLTIVGCSAGTTHPAAPDLVVPILPAPTATTEPPAESPEPLWRPSAPLPPTGLPPPSPGDPSATFDAKGFTIDKALERKLHSGLRITLELFDGAQSVATCVVRYDLWDEVFDTDGKARMRTTQQAVRSCMNAVPKSTITAVAR